MDSPRLVKGGLVQVDATTGRPVRVIALQYNPDSLTRTLQVQAAGGEGGDKSQALRLRGAAVETIKLEAEIDATDRLEFPDQNATARGDRWRRHRLRTRSLRPNRAQRHTAHCP